MITEIAFVFSLLLTAACVFGICFLLRYSKSSKQRGALITVLVFWIIAYGAHTMRLSGAIPDMKPVVGFFTFEVMPMGMMGFMALIYYCLISITSHRLPIRRFLIYVIPFTVIMLVYLVVCYAQGVSPFAKYVTFEEFKVVAFTAPMILRYLLLLSFLAYVIALTHSIRLLIPVCNKYVESNQSNIEYSLLWLGNFVKVVACIAVVYFIWVIYSSPITLILYCLVTIPAFVILSDNSVYHKPYKPLDRLNLKGNGIDWEIVLADCESCKEIIGVSDEVSAEKKPAFDFADFEKWIEESRPYVNPDFSFGDVHVHFPQLTFVSLGEVLAEQGETFQSYVRRCRIESAVGLMKDNASPSLYKEVYLMVGFKHYSSFSRAFVAVKGVSPSKMFNE